METDLKRKVVGQVLSIREESTATGDCLPATAIYTFCFNWRRVDQSIGKAVLVLDKNYIFLKYSFNYIFKRKLIISRMYSIKKKI